MTVDDRPVLAVVASHPIQYFSPWFRAVAATGRVDLHVLYLSRRGVDGYFDHQFAQRIEWDVPLLDGFASEFLPERGEPDERRPWRNDNPTVTQRLDQLDPDVVLVFGYARRANWRVVRWARRRGRKLLLYSDSNATRAVSPLRGLAKRVVVGSFYRGVDGALFNSSNNRRYHERYGRRRMQLYPCRLPVDLDRLTSGTDAAADRQRIRAQHGIPEDAFVVVFCGKLAPHKRPEDLLRAVAALKGPRRCGPCSWAMGRTGGSWRGSPPTRRGTESCSPASSTRRRSGGTTPPPMRAALPSSSEAHGLAVTEATAFGLPVVVSDQVGCIGRDDVARPGVNVFVHECGDVPALAEAIDRLRRDPHLCADMGRASRAIAATQDVQTAAQLLCDAVIDLREATKGPA